MISADIVEFFHNQHFAIISTIDEKGFPHNSCKGIVEMDGSGRVYLLDLYMAETYKNLLRLPYISITSVDEHKFIGYCLKGKARIIPKGKVNKRILKLWEAKITNRISHRVLKNMKGEKGHRSHPEALLPLPAYLIAVDVAKIIKLTPHYMRKTSN